MLESAPFPALTIFTPGLVRCFGAALVACALASCAKDKGTERTVTSTRKVVSKGTGLEGDDGAYMEHKFGMDVDQIKAMGSGTGKRSQFEGSRNITFAGGVSGGDYRKSVYNAPAWNGNLNARSSGYAGRTDGSRFQKKSKFQGTSASQMARTSRFEGTAARGVSNYRTGNATEASGRQLEKPTDGWTDFRRRVYPEPLIMSKQDFDRLTVEQTRSILGRDD